MRNNRNTEIRSLNGPKRKLILEVIDGKRYIKKRDLQHYYFKNKWTIKDFQYHFGLGHRIVRSSLYKWFTAEDIDKSHREKLADSQKGDNNSNRVNWYRPSKLIPLDVLESTVQKVTSIKDLKKTLNLTSYELSFIQQFYNFKLPNKNTLIDDFSVHHLSKREIKLLAKFTFLFDDSSNMLSNDTKLIHKAICKMMFLQYELKYILRKLRRYYRDYDYHIPTNLIEYQFYRELKRRVNKVIPQFYIKSLGIHVDFLINDHYILELDGQLHNLSQDIDRDTKLNKLGYSIIRINLKKSGLSRFNTYKAIRKCLKKEVLPKLNL